MTCEIELQFQNSELRVMSRTISLLDRVRIASPCSVPWASMSGDAKVRHCGQCQHNVYNVVEMKRGEAEALIREREGDRVCLRLHQRRDGTVITKDCPIGLAAARKRLAWLVLGTAAVIGFLIGIGSVIAGRTNGGMRLRYFEPFQRLAVWLNPPVHFTVMGDFSNPNAQAQNSNSPKTSYIVITKPVSVPSNAPNP
jgi:hypothetical protein